MLGTLCVFDRVAKKLRPGQVSRLLDLADIIVALFERRRQARELAELTAEGERRKRFMATVLDTVDVGIAMADPSGHVSVLNRAAREMHGVAAEPAVGRYGVFERERERESSKIPLRSLLPSLSSLVPSPPSFGGGGGGARTEMTIKRPDGVTVDVICHAHRIVDDCDELLGTVVTMHNVTGVRER